MQCKNFKDDRLRLDCFDRAVAQMQKALDAKEIAIVDPKSAPSPGALAASGAAKEREGFEPFQQLETEVRSAMSGPDGNWIIVLKQGGTWRQIDGVALAKRPKPADRVTVLRAALGSYKMRIAGQSAVRVRRIP